MHVETRDLTDTVVLVTGAGAGIGAATAELLTDHGARVVVADRDLDAATTLTDRLPEGRALARTMDVRSPDDARAAVRAAVERWGRLDSVVCNAGIGVFGGILDYPDERLAAIVDTNVLGTVWAVRAAVEQFDTAGAGGDIVIVASVAGLGTASGQESVYAATSSVRSASPSPWIVSSGRVASVSARSPRPRSTPASRTGSAAPPTTPSRSPT